MLAFDLVGAGRQTDRFGFSIGFLQQNRIVLENHDDLGMFRAQRFVDDRQGPLVQRFGFLEFPLIAVKGREVIETLGDIRVVSTQRLLTNGKRTQRQLLGFLVFPLIVVHQRSSC